MDPQHRPNNLHSIAQFTLFVYSYLPLFLMIAFRQISENVQFLCWGGFRWNAIERFATHFGVSILLLIAALVGFTGYWFTFKNIESVADNGRPVVISDVKNKNGEAAGYIATYIIPFLFQRFDGWYECLSMLLLLIIIYKIYVNSSLLLINPLLSICFGIYEIEYLDNQRRRNGLIISRSKFLNEEAEVKLYEIGHKLFFAKELNEEL